MFTAALPLAVLFVASQARHAGFPARSALLAALIAILITGWQTLPGAKETVRIALHGAWESGYLPVSIAERLGSKITDEPNANPLSFARIGQRADRIRERLGLARLTLMAPDVGGLGLCCNETLRVIDNALLTDPVLARQGWEAFPSRIRDERPELILTHRMWAEASDIYQTGILRQEYVPLDYENTLFWLRADLADQVRGWSSEMVAPAEIASSGFTNDFDDADRAFLAAQERSVLAVQDP